MWSKFKKNKSLICSWGLLILSYSILLYATVCNPLIAILSAIGCLFGTLANKWIKVNKCQKF